MASGVRNWKRSLQIPNVAKTKGAALWLKCPFALRCKKHRADLSPKFDEKMSERNCTLACELSSECNKSERSEAYEASLSSGIDVHLFAQRLFSKGVAINYDTWENEAIIQTEKFINDGVEVIFEAVAQTSSGEYCAADILKKNEDGSFDIIEVKSSTDYKEYHLQDLAFQHYVKTSENQLGACGQLVERELQNTEGVMCSKTLAITSKIVMSQRLTTNMYEMARLSLKNYSNLI